MAMTKKYKVSFEVTAVLSTEDQKDMEQDMLNFIKQVGKGEVVPDPLQKEMIVQFLTGGMEAAVSFVTRNLLRETVKDAQDEFMNEDQFRFSPATVREVF